MADKKGSEEARVAAFDRDAPAADEVDEAGQAVLRVSKGDMPAPDPRHAGPDKLGRPARFDPNAALRAKRGVGPGLQDSEVINPAVWVDVDADQSRKAAADAHVQDAERQLQQAKDRSKAIRKGDPLDQEVR